MARNGMLGPGSVAAQDAKRGKERQNAASRANYTMTKQLPQEETNVIIPVS